ncbi:hypothetical protein CHCC20335_3169 [Bacillus paralicheniformis]|nr:hypothetical protein CHCC20335_3169 [Bacillus paralicheniformis]
MDQLITLNHITLKHPLKKAIYQTAADSFTVLTIIAEIRQPSAIKKRAKRAFCFRPSPFFP